MILQRKTDPYYSECKKQDCKHGDPDYILAREIPAGFDRIEHIDYFRDDYRPRYKEELIILEGAFKIQSGHVEHHMCNAATRTRVSSDFPDRAGDAYTGKTVKNIVGCTY